MKTLIVLPSYNERENIINLIQALLQLNPNYSVCVVDDSSPDKTFELIAQNLAENPLFHNRVHLIVRSKKNGRGGAVCDGFALGLNSNEDFNYFVEMDCDFSHEPKAVLEGISYLEQGSDVALGCRYPNGTIIGWPIQRRIFSFFANFLAKNLIDPSIPDYTNGFRFYTKRAVASILSYPRKYTGYIYLSESLSHLLKLNMKIRCFPTVFRNRIRGVSNTSLKEVIDALTGIFVIAKQHHFS